MSYIRVIPRDLFNEGNLLKCLGKLALEVDRLNIPYVEISYDGEAFDIQQDPCDGSIYAANVLLRRNRAICSLFRPLNSRDPWPLYLAHRDEEIPVYTDDGELTPEFLEFLKGGG
jgi:hypothetical protein